MQSENIFDIWRFLGKGTPFIVRRNGWFHLSPQEEPIDCCGCGNWELIENLIEDVDALQWNCLDANNNLTFGKYKGMNVEDIKNKDGVIYLTHTEVPMELGGKGIGSQLVEKVLLDIEKKDLRLVPLCPFVAGYIQKHPDWKRIVMSGIHV